MPRPFLLNGKWTESAAQLMLQSPWPGVFCEPVFEASAEQAREAARAALQAFGAWRLTPRFKRAEALRRIAQKIGAQSEALAALIRDECGKPMNLSRAEVRRAENVFALAAEECQRTSEPIDPEREAHGAGLTARVEYFPAGPVLGITPFNFPLNLAAHKIAPALAAGCPIVLKPPPQAPGPTLLLGKIALEAGLHPAAFQVLPGGIETGKALSACPEFAALSFTGSARAGWELKRNADPRQKIWLELGGNAALLVDHDADLDAAAAAVATGGYAYSGQVCISTQRVFVHRAVADEFESKLAAKILCDVKSSADPADEHALVGPLIDSKAANRIEAWIKSALDSGARALIRGARQNANLITPWLLENVPPDQPLSCEEVFGPVVVLERIDDFDSGLARINRSQYGLQASVFTRSLAHAEQAFRELEQGAVLINLPTSFRLDSAPYGGVKGSGFGREGVRDAMRAFSEPRLMLVKGK